MPVHEVLVPLFDGVQPLDVAGPHEVLAGAGQLECEPMLVAVAAARAGFGSAETMRRAFLRRLGVPPDHYRRRFAVPH